MYTVLYSVYTVLFLSSLKVKGNSTATFAAHARQVQWANVLSTDSTVGQKKKNDSKVSSGGQYSVPSAELY